MRLISDQVVRSRFHRCHLLHVHRSLLCAYCHLSTNLVRSAQTQSSPGHDLRFLCSLLQHLAQLLTFQKFQKRQPLEGSREAWFVAFRAISFGCHFGDTSWRMFRRRFGNVSSAETTGNKSHQNGWSNLDNEVMDIGCGFSYGGTFSRTWYLPKYLAACHFPTARSWWCTVVHRYIKILCERVIKNKCQMVETN